MRRLEPKHDLVRADSGSKESAKGRDQCALCGRSHPRLRLTRHHLTPKLISRRRKKGKHKSKQWKAEKAALAEQARETVDLCGDCHRMVHATLTERELADGYETLVKLRTHPDLERFAHWAAKQDPMRRQAVRGGKRRKR